MSTLKSQGGAPDAGGSDVGEFELIRRFFMRPGTTPRGGGVILGIGDDAALLDVPAHAELAAAVDTIVEGRHFPLGSDPCSIGHRALAVNLSDLAAMGATPAWATLALTLPRADSDWLRRFADGLLDLADAHGVALVGGDTTRGPLTVSVQVLGHVPRGTAMRRSGARAGDLLAVTGTLGDAGAGLALIDGSFTSEDPTLAAQLVRRFEYPAPRVEFGMAARGLASAAMDLSDGMVGDLPKLASACGLAAHVDVERLPLSSALRAVAAPQQARDWALAAGDDYELLVAVPPHRYADLMSAAGRLDLTLSTIGELRSGNGVFWSLHGREFTPTVRGYDHFR
jgi:thiamine-monophosphate kinase